MCISWDTKDPKYIVSPVIICNKKFITGHKQHKYRNVGQAHISLDTNCDDDNLYIRCVPYILIIFDADRV